MDHVVNQIIKRRVEEIANRQMAVETDDAHPDEEEQRRRAKELEAQKAKEASQQDTDPKLAAVKALGDAKEAEAAPEAEAADAPEAPAAVAEAAFAAARNSDQAAQRLLRKRRLTHCRGAGQHTILLRGKQTAYMI